ncbi:MAG: hypothetical protein KF795_33855 [Labilithrix sp.]|nr:hypothetical protein [Labilithrix sp.]
MDAIVGVWLTSLVGAAAFSAAGYVLGQRGVVLPLLGLSGRPAGAPDGADRHVNDDAPPATKSSPFAERVTPATEATETPLAVAVTPATDAPPRAAPAGDDGTDDDDDRPTLVPDTVTQAAVVAAAVATIPPPRAPSIRIDGLPSATDAELQAALAKAEAATARARAAEVVKSELERQIEAVRAELRNEVVARATAGARADELGDRLANASEEAASLRHKVSVLDKQAKQLREALQGRVRALTTSEWHRRRDLEETEEMRVKLRDVYDKLERSSLPPASSASSPPPSASLPPGASSPGMPAVPRSLRPDDGDATKLRDEIARLSLENRDLRARALGSIPPKQPPQIDLQDVDVDAYRELIEHIGSVAGLKSAILADDRGSLLVGSGDLAEGLAAFGAYIRDAASRTERLLPLEGVDEVDIRDRRGLLLSTRVVARSPSELCLVVLGSAEASLAAARNIVDEHLRLRRS